MLLPISQRRKLGKWLKTSLAPVRLISPPLNYP